MRPQRRNTNWNLYKLVEIINDNIIINALKVALDGMFYHLVIGSDNECRMFQKQEQTNSLQSGDRGFGKAAVQIVDEYHQGDAHLLEQFFETRA
ncbi:protein of unknown function [Sterolibacterium denitrificans]|uniref:Uncharacterized protein n=1 Tax=Sterolibacterium denitrificans TaxID=157592 RepID=A0A7Z7MVS1_9PROT|nr:protein of unknown function [Sterolibacterium denitrificans]